MGLTGKTRWLIWGLWFHGCLVILTVLLGVVAIIGTFIDKSGRFPQSVARLWSRLLLRLSRVSVQVEGLEHVEPGKNYVFAANHRSQFDIFVLLATLPGQLSWVAKKSLFQIPIFGQAMARMGSVPIDRSNRSQAIRSLNEAAHKVQQGFSMIIFPEGTRGTGGELLPFKKGVFIMALKAGQPIIPVSISGTLAIQPRRSLMIRPGPVKVVLSPPIDPLAFRHKEQLMEAVREAIAANFDPNFPYG